MEKKWKNLLIIGTGSCAVFGIGFWCGRRYGSKRQKIVCLGQINPPKADVTNETSAMEPMPKLASEPSPITDVIESAPLPAEPVPVSNEQFRKPRENRRKKTKITPELDARIMELVMENKSLREIMELCNVGESTVNRRIRKAKNESLIPDTRRSKNYKSKHITT